MHGNAGRRSPEIKRGGPRRRCADGIGSARLAERAAGWLLIPARPARLRRFPRPSRMVLPAAVVTAVLGAVAGAVDDDGHAYRHSLRAARRAAWSRDNMTDTILRRADASHRAYLDRHDVQMHGGHNGRHLPDLDVLGPVGPACADLELFGAGDESKAACGLSRANAPCTIISVGSNNQVGAWAPQPLNPHPHSPTLTLTLALALYNPTQWGFEVAAFDRTPCRIATFDCTISNDTRPPARIAPRTAFHHVCLSAHVSAGATRTGRRYVDWPTLLGMAGLTSAPAFLKIDIEGVERELLHAMVSSGPRRLLSRQIAVEVHLNMDPSTYTSVKAETRYRVTPAALPWHGRLQALAGLALMMHELWELGGFTLVHRRDNVHWSGGTDLLLARGREE